MKPTHDRPLWTSGAKTLLGLLLLGQFIGAYLTGTGRILIFDEGFPVPPVAFMVAIPVALFFAVYGLSAGFRRFVLAQDIRTLTTLQLWRVVGFAFLPLYAVGTLPGLFALPAGLGDVAVGIAAFFVVRRLDADPDFVKSRAFIVFNFLGLLDFAVAIGTGRLSGNAEINEWPLILFPGFFVPAFLILHVAVLLQVRHLRRGAASTAPIPAQIG